MPKAVWGPLVRSTDSPDDLFTNQGRKQRKDSGEQAQSSANHEVSPKMGPLHQNLSLEFFSKGKISEFKGALRRAVL